ncbi:MAG: hypothetical protein ACXADX_06995 [Candidatus Hodarchaeales archaeon]
MNFATFIKKRMRRRENSDDSPEDTHSSRTETRCSNMRLLIFTEGTILMHGSAKGRTREEIVSQSREGIDPLLSDWKQYVPIGDAPRKLQLWKEQGAEILYLTSRTSKPEIDAIQLVLEKHGFPKGELCFRRQGEKYKNVAERVLPDVLIEDNCESIGGEVEMTYPHIHPKRQKRIKSIVVKEFEGVDHLPEKLATLKS